MRSKSRLFDDGGGDIRLYRVTTVDDSVPAGLLAPIPNLSGFDTRREAIRYMKANPDEFRGMQVLIFKGLDIVSPMIAQPQVELVFKPRRTSE